MTANKCFQRACEQKEWLMLKIKWLHRISWSLRSLPARRVLISCHLNSHLSSHRLFKYYQSVAISERPYDCNSPAACLARIMAAWSSLAFWNSEPDIYTSQVSMDKLSSAGQSRGAYRVLVLLNNMFVSMKTCHQIG
jgi:hypothetical protein